MKNKESYLSKIKNLDGLDPQKMAQIKGGFSEIERQRRAEILNQTPIIDKQNFS